MQDDKYSCHFPNVPTGRLESCLAVMKGPKASRRDQAVRDVHVKADAAIRVLLGIVAYQLSAHQGPLARHQLPTSGAHRSGS